MVGPGFESEWEKTETGEAWGLFAKEEIKSGPEIRHIVPHNT
jgi:hypothetical protein